MLLQFPIIIALYWVIRQPITYMMGLNDIEQQALLIVNFNDWAALHPDSLIGDLAELFESGKRITGNNYSQYEIQIAQLIHHESSLMNFVGEAAKINGMGAISSLNLNTVDFSFLGLNLAETPSLGKIWTLLTGNMGQVSMHDAALWLIPLGSGLSSWVSSKFAQGASQKKKVDKNIILPENEREPEQANPMQGMTVVMPIISAWFTFSFPAALGLYWIISNIYQIILTI
jgi:YidC/Oxa1 family membrane protein insertase